MRVVFFISIAALGFALPFPAFLLCALWYALRYYAPELLILGAVIDAQYGLSLGGIGFPFAYTVALALLVLMIEEVKPHLSGMAVSN